jgi:hypothetical protein
MRDEAVCAVCARMEAGYGYHPRGAFQHAIWVCDDPDCLKIARGIYAMHQDRFTMLERLAAIEGGAKGGDYLEAIGKSDLAALTVQDYEEFCRRVIAGYRAQLKFLCATEPHAR